MLPASSGHKVLSASAGVPGCDSETSSGRHLGGVGVREDLWPYVFDSESYHGEGSPSHAGLFVSLLMRYPEISSVRYRPENACLVIGFTVRQDLTEDDFAALKERLELSLEVFSDLSGKPIHVLELRHIHVAPFTVLEVVRDVQTLTQMELSVIVGTLADRFGESLVYEPIIPEETDEPFLQDDLIEHLLDDVRLVPPPRQVIGFREDGRVVVRGDDRDH